MSLARQAIILKMKLFSRASLALLATLSIAFAKDLKFVVYGDTRDGHAVHRKLVKMIMAEHPDLVLQTGDLVHRGEDESLWKIYDDITGDMRKKIPVYPARGNHDLGGPGYENRVTEAFTSGNKLFYSFDKEGCHFVSIDSFSPYKPGSPQYKWLENDLSKSENARAVFVFFHVPPYSVGTVHGPDLEIRKALCPLFEKYHVTAVFNGHEHIYYRTVRNGIPYVIAGGGGAPLYPIDPGLAEKGDVYASVHHYCVCEISGNTMRLRTFTDKGKKIDEATIPLRATL